MLDVYVDGDACPVKSEICRVARRHELKVWLVAHSALPAPDWDRAERVRVRPGFGAADDWIVEHIGEGDIAVTADIPLADRCLKKGARVLAPNGKVFTEDSIGSSLATREILEHLRQMGQVGGGPPPFAAADRSRFLSRLDATIVAIRRKRTRPT